MSPPDAWARDLRVSRLRFTLRPEAPWTLPRDPHLTLRGALGRAVMDLSCRRPGPDCVGCPHLDGCPVPSWYDPGRAGGSLPRPLLLDPLAPGGARLGPEAPLEVEALLLGALPHPALLVEALHHMGREGLGPGRVPHHLDALTVDGVTPDPGAWPEPGGLDALLRTPPRPRGLSLHLTRPTRWSGLGPRRPPQPAELLRAAMGRLRQVARARGRSLDRWWPDPEGLEGRWLEARWQGRSRRSARTGARVDLSGWTGHLELGPEVEAWADLLAAVAVLGLGKGVSAGQGRVALSWR